MAGIPFLSRGNVMAGGFQGRTGGTPAKGFYTGSANVDPPSIGATTRATATITIPGVAAGDLVVLEPPSALEAALLFVGCFVSGADTVTIMLYNTSGGAVDGTSRSWGYRWIDLT